MNINLTMIGQLIMFAMFTWFHTLRSISLYFTNTMILKL